jgi:hypothetical protein
VIEITRHIIDRSKHIGLSDPCVICGGKFGVEFGTKDACPHTQDEVNAVLQRIKVMSPKRREAIRRGYW